MRRKEGGLETKTYTVEEAKATSLEYFNGDKLAADQFVRKYSLKDSLGNIYEDSPDKMHLRMAKEVARIEEKYKGPNQLSKEKIYSLFENFKYLIPGGSNMSGIGNNKQIVSLSNCFVIGPEFGTSLDSYGGIIYTDQEQVQLMKRRGGVGHDLSHIRPKGSDVMNSALTSTGIVPFMERYSNSTKEVAQDGRRGALMLSLSIKHPDIERFIDAKMIDGKITGANISIKIDDEFMKAVKNNKPYIQQYPVDSAKPDFKQEIDAKKLWGKIIHNAWKSAEPGVLFWDTIKREAIPDVYSEEGFKTVSTNPCGEIPLCPYDSCRLLALNLYNYVENPFTNNAKFDEDLFKEHTRDALRIMDDIIDLEKEKINSILKKIDDDPEPDYIKATEKRLWKNILEKTEKGRRTGIGITAEGDMLAALGFRYGSDEATKFSTNVHKTLAIETYRESVELAKERGPFPIYNAEKEKDNPFINRIKEADPNLYEEMVKHGRRNISLLTIAPTGTSSIMAQTTSGIESVFLAAYKRKVKIEANDKDTSVDEVDKEGIKWHHYNVFHQKFKEWLIINGHDFEEIKNIKDEEELNKIVEKSPYYKASSKDVDWVKKVKMQGEIQKWVDHSISATTNIPKETSEEVVANIYMTAWESGCKGMTIYREGSREGILSSNNEGNGDHNVGKRPRILEADVIRFNNNDEKWIAFVGLKDGRPYEIFTGLADEEVLPIPKKIHKGKIIKEKNEDGNNRYDFQYLDKYGYKKTFEGLSHIFKSEFWNYAKLISGVLRHGMPIPSAVNLVSSLKLDSENINTWKNGVERVLTRYIPDGTKKKGICEDCKSKNLVYQEGCLLCHDCGSSKCG